MLFTDAGLKTAVANVAPARLQPVSFPLPPSPLALTPTPTPFPAPHPSAPLLPTEDSGPARRMTYGPIGGWDVSNVTDMELLLHDIDFGSEPHPDLNQWDVSRVTNMRDMFINSNYNGELNSWDVSRCAAACHPPLRSVPPSMSGRCRFVAGSRT